MFNPPNSDPHGGIKATLWVYFWLLIWEGMFRKWIFPGLSDVIFVIRDPVVIFAYLLAIRAKVFPWRPAVAVVVLMAALSLVMAIPNDNRLLVTLFGIRTDFLHLPLIFLMARVLDRNDVIRYGRWFMILSVPILLIMVKQFNAPSDSAWNVAVGGVASGQLRGAMGRIRPPGPFSFVTGPVDYFGVVAAFVFYGWLQPKVYGRLLVYVATAVTIVVIPVSISRSLLLGILIVTFFGLVVAVRDPRRIPHFLGPLVAAAGFLALAIDSVYVQAFSTRWDEAETSSNAAGTLARLVGGFTEPFTLATQAPLFGYGIGMGTLAGARLSTGEYSFLLAESELARCILELGPILGFAFIAWRFWLAVKLVFGSWKSFSDNADPLPWLIAGSTFFGVIAGQWGPTTNLGFSVFGAGLTLAAMNIPEGHETGEEAEGEEAALEPEASDQPAEA